MTEQTTSHNAPNGEETGSGWVGFIFFAGVIMILGGVFQALAGLIGLFEDEFYVATREYIFEFDATTWGWIHLLLGLLVMFAGFAIIAGQTWGRVVGIILVSVSALANFAFIPYYPIWAIIVITLDVLVLWALSVHGGDIRRYTQ